MLPAAPERRRYRPRSAPRRRLERRQAETPAVEEEVLPVEEEVSSASEGESVDSGLDSGVDSGIDSGVESDSEDDETVSYGAPAPTAVVESSGSALTTFQVDKGGVIATSLPGDSADVDPPLNVGLPGTVTTSASETAVTEFTSESVRYLTFE